MDSFIILITSIIIIFILCEELLKDFLKVRIIIYGLLFGVFLQFIRIFFEGNVSLVFNYLSLFIFIITPLIMLYYFVSDILGNRENENNKNNE